MVSAGRVLMVLVVVVMVQVLVEVQGVDLQMVVDRPLRRETYCWDNGTDNLVHGESGI